MFLQKDNLNEAVEAVLKGFIIGIPLTPLVWQFMRVYREKIARDSQLTQWEEVK